MLHNIRRSIKRVSRSFGYDIVALRETQERGLALHLFQLFKALAVDCVFDVGANQGQYRDFLREHVLYDGMIVSFEPLSRNIDILHERSHDDANWIIQPYALGRAADERPNQTAQREKVDVRKFDDVLCEMRRHLHIRNFYLKLDTEGLDLQVLEGAQAELSRCCALQTEASVIGIYRGMPNYVQTIQYLNQRNFDITGLYPIRRDPSLRLIEFDCVMINRKRADHLAPMPSH